VSTSALHPASADEAEAVWPAVNAAHLFDSHARFHRFRAEAPWRVQVTGRGEAVVLEEWRTHLDVLAMRGLWCSGDRVPHVVQEIARVAADQGYGRLLSPLVAADVAPVYERAGFSVHGSIVALRLDRGAWDPEEPRPAPDVRLRQALADDLPALVRIDAECFDDFWRYDADRLARYLVEDRLVVAAGAEGPIGYTLATVVRGSGTLGRLAVTPSARGRGTGEALLREALAYLLRTGVGTVSLCTQEDNYASRTLYGKVGLTELTGHLVFLMRSTGSAGKRGKE
jgi:[ribosomal protein S18]-alanine N-acetyltransferase